MQAVLQVLQIFIATILVVVILMQSRGSGFGGAFGTQAAVFRTRRGIERYLFRGTVMLAAEEVAFYAPASTLPLPRHRDAGRNFCRGRSP